MIKTRKSKHLPYILSTLILTVLGSCSQQQLQLEVELKDPVKGMILDYAKENKIDARSRVITTRWVASSVRTDVYISNSPWMISEAQFDVPTYYSVLGDSLVVFLYSGVESSIERNIEVTVPAIERVLREHHVKLRPAETVFFHAPTWIYSFCDTDSQLIKRSSPYARFHIPCGYSVRQDSVKQDSLIITSVK